VGIVYSERCVPLADALQARPLADVLVAVQKMQRRPVSWLRRITDTILRRKTEVPVLGALDHSPEATAAAGLHRKKVCATVLMARCC
jgi:hypothetical protein